MGAEASVTALGSDTRVVQGASRRGTRHRLASKRRVVQGASRPSGHASPGRAACLAVGTRGALSLVELFKEEVGQHAAGVANLQARVVAPAGRKVVRQHLCGCQLAPALSSHEASLPLPPAVLPACVCLAPTGPPATPAPARPRLYLPRTSRYCSTTDCTTYAAPSSSIWSPLCVFCRQQRAPEQGVGRNIVAGATPPSSTPPPFRVRCTL